MKNNRSPLRWFGGKHYLAPFIISLMPSHQTYVEPFGGGAHVLTQKPPATVDVYNDIDDYVVNFLLILQKEKDRLIERLDQLPFSRSLYERWKWEEWPKDDFERAVRWFYIHRSKIDGGNNHRSGWRHSRERNPATDYRSAVKILESFSTRFRNVMIENLDFRKIIDTYDSPKTLFYIDPPYRGREIRYKGNFTDKDHIDLANMLKNIQGKAIVSYYSDPLINELYSAWNLVTKEAYVGAVNKEHRRKETELIFLNFDQVQMNIFDIAK